MRLFVSITLMMVPLSLASQQPKSKSQQTAPADQRGTQESPLVVKVLPAIKTPEEAAREKKDREDKTENDGNLVKLTGVLAFVGFCQLLVYGYQAKKLRETVESAGEQSEAMERHIAEAARSASAMEAIGTTIEEGNRMIMRAYLTVTVGAALYQERRGPGQSDLKFEARPNLVNTGATPARHVRTRSKAAIVTIPIPEDFAYPLPENPVKPGFGGVLGAHQSNIIFAGLDDFVPDEEVPSIKQGVTQALCTWGTVTYEDIFGAPHITKFGQIITWLPNGNIFVYFIPGQNDSD
jgi:hypothetical protein